METPIPRPDSTTGHAPMSGFRLRLADSALLWLGLLVTVWGVMLVRGPGVMARPHGWMWLLLALGAGVAGFGLQRMERWLPEASPVAAPENPVADRRRCWGLLSLLAGLGSAAWVVVRLWPDIQVWQATPLAWVAALLLMTVGGWLLGAVGQPSRGFGQDFGRDFGPDLHRADTQRFPRWLEVLLFLLILALALGVRTYRLDEIPSALYVDETNAALDALYLLEGRPVSPFATGWYETPNGYIYYMAGLFKLFGANYWTLKAASLIPALLTIPAVFFLGRYLFGSLAGLAAMFLLAISRWHMTLSRWGWNELMPPLFQTVATLLLMRGLRERRALDYAVGGLISGLMIYTYLSSRLALLTLALFALYWLLTDSDGPVAALNRHATGLLLFALAALVAMAPLLVTYATHPFLFFNRSAEISIFNEVTQTGSWQPFWENLWRHVQLFYQFGDPVGRQNLPGEPQTDPVTGTLLAIGLAYGLFAWRDRRRGLLWIWLVVALAGGFLSELHVNSAFAPAYLISPNSYRTLSALVAVVLIAGDVVSRLVRSLSWVLPGRITPTADRWVRTSIGVTLLLLPAAWELPLYFGVQSASSAVQNSFNQIETRVGQAVVEGLAGGEDVYLSPTFYNFSPLRFLVYGAVRGQVAENPLEHPPYRLARPEVDLPLSAAGNGALLLLELHYESLLGYVTGFYPNAEVQMVRGPGDVPLFWQIRIPLADLMVYRGLMRTLITTNGKSTVEQVVGFDLPAQIESAQIESVQTDIRELRWTGTLQVPASGLYTFTATQAQLFIDGSLWDKPRYLSRGLHEITLHQSDFSGQSPRLTWRMGDGAVASVPLSAFFTAGMPAQGLTGLYFAGDNWAGTPVFQQVTPFLLLAWPQDEPLPHPFSAIFVGSLRIETPGTYRFRLHADDGIRFVLDGVVLGEALTPDQPNQFSVDVALTPGLHDLRIDYFQRYGGSALQFWWQPPGQAEVPVPPDVLVPKLFYP